MKSYIQSTHEDDDILSSSVGTLSSLTGGVGYFFTSVKQVGHTVNIVDIIRAFTSCNPIDAVNCKVPDGTPKTEDSTENMSGPMNLYIQSRICTYMSKEINNFTENQAIEKKCLNIK